MARPSGTKEIETPQELWDLFCDYVKYEQNTPMFKTEYVGREGERVRTPLETPITFEGFECYLWDKDIVQHLGHYCDVKNESYKDYLPIVTRIKQNCFVHNFKGASVGLFNANIIARKLNLVEKTNNENTGDVTITVKYDEKPNDNT